MSTIAIDIDGTLYPFEPAAHDAFFELAEEQDRPELKVGAYRAWHQWRDPVDVCGKQAFIEVVNRVHQPEVILKQIAYPGAASVVRDLYEKHDIIYLTNRKRDVTHESTSQWLCSQGFPHAELVCCEHYSKTPYLLNCQYIIDDRPRTLIEFVYDYSWKFKHGTQSQKRIGFSLLHPYNEALTDIEQIYLAPSWVGIRHYLEKEGVL